MPFFIGAALIHASLVDIADAEKAGAPILNLPSKDEPDMVNKKERYKMMKYILIFFSFF